MSKSFVFAKKPSSYSTIKEVAIKLDCKPTTISKGIAYGMIKTEKSRPAGRGNTMHIVKNSDLPTIKKMIPTIRKKIHSELSYLTVKKPETSVDKVAIKKVISYLTNMIA